MDQAQVEKVLGWAWDYGHFRNPAYVNAQNVQSRDEAIKLPLGGAEAMEAMRSMQGIDANLDNLSFAHHGRESVADGDVGPATLALADLPRCGCPDYGLEYGLENAGSGGWNDCDPGKVFPDAEHSIAIKFDETNAPAKWRGYMDQVKQNAINISADMGLAVRHLPANTNENYQSSCIFRFISGGVIGFYYIPRGNSCSRVPQGALDTSFQPDVQMASLLWIHEGLGHGVGLPHTRGGIMNPSIIRVPITWRNDPSFNRMRSMYTGKPLQPGPGPGPGPDPTVIARFTAEKAGQKFTVISGEGTGGGWDI